ncbi:MULTISPECIES: isoaspartyl peptidase/L-asparaginase family protein [Proteus]|uniref:isoaspartyl peptidase/L-asparaginase family protein n=1 Tax=Proteus TaxID=583 RepID=UPI000BFC4218|nr:MULTISPECIES: isoaspartyl peptidase/L-asparaginase [Proteus]ATN00514.1 beta-aspartyl-peptidase [Proteus vulgaris]MBG2836127.1 isoaspartyl peptidase/L-asparaginase [Proteus terrae subsp. cibarius]MBG2867229.1 isoaspartyl peptidase/L-asparaginase [Proteus terrae subsp. cibarius]MBJ2107956.1 isoaspartyl peptidase/L-asparaginase [Proteus terrae]MBJ2131828.1 isoaspartyl peptidase/L-asparaginase [Proteus terrae]
MNNIKYKLATMTLCTLFATSVFANTDTPIRLVIHGGAGTITKDTITPEQEKEYKEKLTEALNAGYAVLNSGGTSIEAVQKSINVMEDSPLFNAGKGAVFTHDGRNELDASIMDGKTRKAGAVASVTTVKNPINAAIAVMEKSPHVMMVSNGADLFAKEQGLTIVDPSYFRTEHRWQQLQKAIEKEQVVLDHDGKTAALFIDPMMYDYKYGTVGAVALDQHGNLAAGTSTGGMTNKRYGRVGDSPIIGAGNYADNETVAVSATGSGEMFIRTLTAFNIAAQVKYKNLPLKEAAQNALDEVKAINGSGGVIVLDKTGNYTMSFNSEGMYRGTIGNDGKPVVAIYKE